MNKTKIINYPVQLMRVIQDLESEGMTEITKVTRSGKEIIIDYEVN